MPKAWIRVMAVAAIVAGVGASAPAGAAELRGEEPTTEAGCVFWPDSNWYKLPEVATPLHKVVCTFSCDGISKLTVWARGWNFEAGAECGTWIRTCSVPAGLTTYETCQGGAVIPPTSGTGKCWIEVRSYPFQDPETLVPVGLVRQVACTG